MDSNPFMRLIASYLRANKPPPALTLVHGDFQIANILIADDGYYMVRLGLAHVGDPREDLGWMMFASVTQPPDVIAEDPEAFYSRYRELTGLSEEIINPATIDYFVMLAAATVFIPVVQQFEAVVKGESTGIMVTYMSNAIAGMHNVLMNAMARHRCPPEVPHDLKPSTAQLIEAVNAELASKVSPELDAGTTRVVLDMAMAVLQGAATRSANELAWMREEEQAVADVGSDWWRAAVGDRSGRGISGLHGQPVRQPVPGRRDGRLRAGQRGAVLRGRGGVRRRRPGRIAAVQELFDQRLANERGDRCFQAVGRTWLSTAPPVGRGALILSGR